MPEGLDKMRIRLGWMGGNRDKRMVNEKYRSFSKALKDSYQGEWITLKDGEIFRCLINQNKLTEDYDQKTLSIDFCSKVKEGDVFLWNRTKTHWIVLLQQLTEEAYFRGQIRRCDYKIAVDEEEYWIYLRGPQQTTEEWQTQHNLAINGLNYTLMFYVTKNDTTKEFFQDIKE